MAQTLEAEAPRIELGRVRPRRPARAHELRDAREGAAGRRRGEGRDARSACRCRSTIPAATCSTRGGTRRASRRRCATARAGAELLLAARRRQPAAHRRGVRRPGAADAAVLDAVGLVRARRRALRRRRRRQAARSSSTTASARGEDVRPARENAGRRALGEVRRHARRGARHPEPRRARRAGPRRDDRPARITSAANARPVGYDDADARAWRRTRSTVEKGDMVCFYTGFADVILELKKKPGPEAAAQHLHAGSTAATTGCCSG